jgi:hypothetical protein
MPPKAKGQGRDGAGAASAARGARIAQAFIEAMAEDPEAVSAFGVARGRLAAGRGLLGLRRMRVFELSGALPGRAALAGLLHRSIQFYNPAKERCTLRLQAGEAAPIGADEIGVLVVERGGERRPAAERWWRHETGTTVEIREGVAWALELAPGVRAEAADDLAILRGREHGLLCNPHWQDARVASGVVPLPWFAERTAEREAAVRVAGATHVYRPRSAPQQKAAAKRAAKTKGRRRRSGP